MSGEVGGGPDPSHESGVRSFAEEAATGLAALNLSVGVYREEYFGRPLGPEEVGEALAEISVMQASSIQLLDVWLSARNQIAGVNPNASSDASAAMQLMEHGATLLRSLRPSVTYATHLQRQCIRLEPGNETAVSVDAAAEAAETLDMIAAGIERDIDLVVARISVLLMEQQRIAVETQTVLNKKITSLTRWTTILTVIIMVLTIFAAVVGAIGAFK